MSPESGGCYIVRTSFPENKQVLMSGRKLTLHKIFCSLITVYPIVVGHQKNELFFSWVPI